MPSLVGSLYVSLTADFGSYQRNMKSAESVTANTAGSIRRNMGLTERSVTQLQRSMGQGIRPGALIAAGRSFDSLASRANLLRGAVFAVTAAFGGLGAALTSNVISRYLDTFTGLSNQMRVVSSGSADLAANIDAVAGVAERSRSSLSAVATLYSRIAKASPGEGALRTLRRVETINKALQLGGATAQEAASAAIQFSQAIASNRLGGEELRAVLETPLGLELAKGIGVTIGELRKMGFEGKLTADVLFKALDKISATIDGQFANSVSTIDQALTVADGKITVFAGHLDETYGITKLLTGGILGLANNLDTVLPLLASVGLGLGSTFAARRVGPGVGNRIAAIRAERQARLENLRLAGEEVAVAAKSRDIAVQQLRTVNQRAQGDAREFASPAAAKRYQRDLNAIQKLDATRLSQLEELRRVQYQIGQVTTATTTKAVSASEKLAAAQAKVNEGMSKRWSIAAQLQKVDKQLANLPKAGVAPNWLFPADVDKQEKDLLSRRQKLAADLARIDAGLGRSRETLAQREIRLSELTTDAERKAAQERAQLLQRHQQMIGSMERTQARRGVFGASLRASGAGVAASGMSAIGGGQIDATQQALAAQARYAETTAKLSAASRAATLTAQGLNVLKGAGMSLIGFLGGPWGAAFTAAIGILTVFGLRARASAEEIARGIQVIEEELAKLEQNAGLSGQTVNQQLTIVDSKIAAETERLKAAQTLLETTRLDLINGLATSLAAQSSLSQGEFLRGYTELAEKLELGEIKLRDFIKGLEKLGLSATAIESVTAAMNDAIARGQSAEQAIDLIQKRLASLNGQRADITVRVNLDDPRGVFQLLTGADATQGANSRLASQYAQYGRGRAAAGNQTFLQNQRTSVMAAAGEQNSITNTPEKIRDRAQALYEEGAAYGLTRDEATKLAAAELNMTEQTRLAGQAARSGAKDYQSFANKLAELRETAAASGLSALDQQVVQFATNLKNGSQMMRDYIAAVNSGDLSKAPAQLLQARDAFIEIEASQAAEGIIQKYGSAAQLAGVFAEKQAILNAAVMNGKITAEQASIAYADFLGQFGEFEWIDQLSSSVTNFLGEIITDFENAEQAALNFAKSLLQIATQAFVLAPLEQFLKGIVGGFMGGGFGGFGTAGGFADMLGIVRHGGGRVDGSGTRRRVPAAAAAGAPRFHKGLNSKEFLSVLERGERVLTGRQEAKTAGVISGLSAQVGAGRGGDMTVQIIDQVGVKKREERGRGPDGEEMLRVFIEEVVDSGLAGGRFDTANKSRFGAQVQTAKRR